MMLNNSIFQYANSSERFRVIYENEKYIYYVELDKDTSMPKQVEREKIQSEIENNILVKISDVFLTNVEEQSIPDNHKVKRNEEWEYVNCIWPSEAEALMETRKRSRIIREKAIELGIQELKLKRILTRFWQRGMTKNSLLPDYKNSGAKGKERKLKDDKVGRPKKINYFGESQEGINATEDIKKIIDIAIDRFYRKKEKPTLKSAYRSMLKEFFSDKYVENGEIKYKVWSQDKIPTYQQFYYWYKKHEDIKKDITFRGSNKEFDLNYRPLTGSSEIETDGPGTRFQIDATVADIYIVSSINRNRIIGRPIIYLIIDVYSRLVTGLYTGLEGPSWIGAMMALDNMLADKVEFCKEYGIDISVEQWPCNHLPEIIIADRGEFEGYSVENLINNLNIKIENTAPYRGDLKGYVKTFVM